MHEYSLVRALLTQVKEAIAGSVGGVVHEIHIECGPLSGVEPVLLKSAFDHLRPRGQLGQAQLIIESVPLAAECLDCGNVFEPPLSSFRCTTCDSCLTKIISGDGVMLDRVVIAEGPEETSV